MNLCACGCGAKVKRTWKVGHDHRVKVQLRKAGLWEDGRTVAEQAHKLSAVQVKRGECNYEHAARMKQALPPLSEVKILQATLRYMQIRGAVPDPRRKSDVDPNDPVESFAAYHEALLSGSRGLGRPREGGYWEFLAEKLSRSRDWVSDYGRIWGAYRERNKYADEREQAMGREEFLARKACEFGRPDFVRYGKAFWVARKVGEDAARKMGLIAAYRLAAAAGSEKGLSGVAEELSAASTRLEREDFVELALRTADELRKDRSA